MSAALPAETVRSRTPAQLEASRLHSLPSGGRSADPGGARSHGPATPEGKARSARNGTRHGLCSTTFFLLPDEDPAAFAAFEHGMLASLNPEDDAERHAAARAVQAMWREIRADRLEAEVLTDLFAANRIEDAAERAAAKAAGLKALATLIRYRNRIQRDRDEALQTFHALRERPRPAAAAPAGRPGEPEKRNADRAAPPRPPAAVAPVPSEPGQPSRPLNRHERRRLAKLERQAERRAA